MNTGKLLNRANELLAQMTLDEKVSMMKYDSPSVERLGIKSYNWWNESLHGVARSGVATMFPQSIGLAATFNPELLYEVADCISTEGRAKYNAYQRQGDGNIYKGLTFWAPNINIFRDPRWGRGHETYGEDPFLTSRLGVAFIRGMQGDDPNYLKTAACAKHYAVHSGPESLRHEFDACVSEKDLYETYLPAFEACVREADVEAVMGAYNAFDGEPCCGSERLLNDILRKEWGFQGHVVSDCGAIGDFHAHHKVTDTPVQSVAMAVKAGCDLNCGQMYGYLMAAINGGLLDESDIDICVRRLLITRLKLGTIGEQKTPWDDIPIEVNDCPEHHGLSLKAARESIVLLKNDGLLPLDLGSIKTVAVIGPNANNIQSLEGNYKGVPSVHYTVLGGMQAACGQEVRILYAQGSHLFKNCIEPVVAPDDDAFSEALSIAEVSDVVILCTGLDASLEGEEGDGFNSDASGDKKDLLLPASQRRLLSAIKKLNKPVVLVNLSGSAIDLSYADENFNAVIQAWYPGQMGGLAVADIITGKYNPSGRLPITFYRTTEELPHFEDYSMANRTYRYMQGEAFYPFGFGLSFSKYSYGNVCADSEKINCGDDFSFSFDVKNAGKYDGGEIAQAYIEVPKTSENMPRWSLCAVKKVFLAAGETKRLSFKLTQNEMLSFNCTGKRSVAKGLYRVNIGGSQPDKRSRELNGSDCAAIEFTVV